MGRAINSAPPLLVIAADIGMSAAIRTSVAQGTARYACSLDSTRNSTIAPAPSRPATTGGTAPLASSAIVTTRMTAARGALRPSGTVCRRTVSDDATTRTSLSSARASSAPHGPYTSSASPSCSVDARDETSSFCLRTDNTSSPSSARTIPPNAGRPIHDERGGITNSQIPLSRLMRLSRWPLMRLPMVSSTVRSASRASVSTAVPTPETTSTSDGSRRCVELSTRPRSDCAATVSIASSVMAARTVFPTSVDAASTCRRKVRTPVVANPDNS